MFPPDARYTKVITAQRQPLISWPLKELEARLPTEQFWRVHRAAIINSARIREVRVRSRDDIAVFLEGWPEPVTVSRAHGHLFRKM